MAKSTCKQCGEKFDTAVMTVISGKKYCPHCAPALLKETQLNTKVRDYLFWLFNGDVDMVTAGWIPIKRLLKDNEEMKLSGILATLEFVFSSRSHDGFKPEWIYNTVSENYYKAKHFYDELKKLKEQDNNSVVSTNLQVPDKEIIITPEAFFEQAERSRKKALEAMYGPLIDLDDLPDDDTYEEDDMYSDEEEEK